MPGLGGNRSDIFQQEGLRLACESIVQLTSLENGDCEGVLIGC